MKNIGLFYPVVISAIVITVIFIAMVITAKANARATINEPFVDDPIAVTDIPDITDIPIVPGMPSQSSRSIFKKAPDNDAFQKVVKSLKLTLSDTDDVLQLDSCIMMKPEFLANINSFKRMNDIYIDSFEMVTDKLDNIRKSIVERLKSLRVQIVAQLLAPIYVMMLQAPYYPKDAANASEMVSIMNFNAKDVYKNQYYNQNINIEPPSVLITVYILLPRHSADGRPQPGRSKTEVEAKLRPFFYHSRDNLCFMKCPGESGSFCGCRNVDAGKPTDIGKATPTYSSTCLGPKEQTERTDYANLYVINAGSRDLLDAESKSIIDIGSAIEIDAQAPVLEYPPRALDDQWWEQEQTNTVKNIDGGSRAVPRFSVNLVKGDYGHGKYTAWTNSIWGFNWSGDQRQWLHPGSAFTNSAGATQPWGSGFWHIEANACRISRQSPIKFDDSVPYLAISMPDLIVIKGYSMKSRPDCCPFQMPTTWTLFGATDEDHWTAIDRQDSVTWSQNERKEFTVTKKNLSAYNLFKIVCPRNGSDSANAIHIGKVKFYGTSGGVAKVAERSCTEAKVAYLEAQPDVAKAGLDAWFHYSVWGRNERRKWPGEACTLNNDKSIFFDVDATNYKPGNNVWQDYSGNGQHLTLFNNPTLVSAPPQYMSFNGNSGAYGQLKNPAGAWVHTISMWMRPQNVDNYPMFIAIGNRADTSKCLHIYIQRDLKGIDYGFWGNDVIATPVPKANAWINAVFIYRGGNGNTNSKEVYINGQKQLTSNWLNPNQPMNLDANANIGVGYFHLNGNNRMIGDIAKVTIYNRAFSAAEVVASFNALRGRFGI